MLPASACSGCAKRLRITRRAFRPELTRRPRFLVTSALPRPSSRRFLGLQDSGDEVIVFEPVYDSYVPNMVMAGVTPRYVACVGENLDFLIRTSSAGIRTPHSSDHCEHGRTTRRESLFTGRTERDRGACQKHN